MRTKIVACAPPRCSCPVLEIEDGIIYITDDYNHVVQMTVEEFEILVAKYMARFSECIVENVDN